MRPTPEADDLDLPPLDGTHGEADEDGDGENKGDHGEEDLEADGHDKHGDAFDDATSEGDPLEDIMVEGAEAGWLLDSEGTGTLDVGGFDLSLSEEGRILEDDEPVLRPIDEDLGDAEDTVHADGGEEGPLADDEELREEDLPALDADDEGDVDDASLYEGASITLDEELRWDDRAWARAEAPGARTAAPAEDADDSGLLAVPGDDPRHAARDATWRRHEEAGRVTAVAFVPGESVVLALDGPGRPMLVRILTDGTARIIAEIESSPAEEEVAASRVNGLRWDEASGCLVATGTFGAQAFRPA